MTPRCGKGGDPTGRQCDSRPDVPESESWEEELRHRLRPGYVAVGVGSRLRGDDAVGSMIAERLAERGLKNCLDCGQAPENYLGKIVGLRPREVLFVDAADFGAAPGTIRLFPADSFQAQSISTHSAGLSTVMDFLSADSDVACWVLAIQPASLTHGAEPSEPVREAIAQVASSDVWFQAGQ